MDSSLAILPYSYFVAVAIFAVLLLHGTLRLRATWSFPYNAALCTVGAWYLIEPLYFSEDFAYFDPRHIELAFNGVVIYLVTFALATPVLVSQFEPRGASLQLSTSHITAERVLTLIAALWFLLLIYGVLRMDGDLYQALFPMQGRAGATMWERAAAADAGSSGFIVSTAGYLYTLCLASFGVMVFLVRNPRYRRVAIVLILISWPYAFLQGSRNITLAVVVPAAISYLLFGRQSLAAKAMVACACFAALEFAMRVIIQYRNEGFENVDLTQVEGATHLGLNMASELVYSIEFIDKGILHLSYGRLYLDELANAIPRALWPDKPLIGIEYAIARGFSGGSSDIGVFATISPGLIGQGVQSFGSIFGPIVAAILTGAWVALLARFRKQATPLRLSLFLVGLGLTFNIGRGLTLLVLWPMVFAYLGARIVELRQKKRMRDERQRLRVPERAALGANQGRPAGSSADPMRPR